MPLFATALGDALFIGSSGGVTTRLPFERLVQHYIELRDLIAKCIHIEHDLDPKLPTLVAMNSFVYAFNTYKAIGLLLPDMHHESGCVILRQLWEVSLNLHWIEQDPETRAADFSTFTVMEHRKLLQKSADPAELSAFDSATARFQTRFRYRDRSGRNKQHCSFAAKTTCDRARELGQPWAREYELLYHLGSMHTHGAPGAIMHAVFQQYDPDSDIRERNAASVVAILAMRLLVRDLHVLVRMALLPASAEIDNACAAMEASIHEPKSVDSISTSVGGG
jgi:Family of unknown function (DUF5677)